MTQSDCHLTPQSLSSLAFKLINKKGQTRRYMRHTRAVTASRAPDVTGLSASIETINLSLSHSPIWAGQAVIHSGQCKQPADLPGDILAVVPTNNQNEQSRMLLYFLPGQECEAGGGREGRQCRDGCHIPRDNEETLTRPRDCLHTSPVCCHCHNICVQEVNNNLHSLDSLPV